MIKFNGRFLEAKSNFMFKFFLKYVLTKKK